MSVAALFTLGAVRRVLGLVLAGLLLVSLAGCATSGTVTSKRFEPGGYRHSAGTTTWTTECTTSGGFPPTTTCRQVPSGSSSSFQYEAECYRLTFRNAKGRTGQDCVSRRVYDALEVGDHYEPASR